MAKCEGAAGSARGRWAGAGFAAAILAAALAWVLFVPAADWLARHDIGNATGNSLETARNNARGNLLALTAGLAGLGALVFTARNFALQRRSLELSQRTFEENAALARRTLELTQHGQQRTHELTEQGQVTDRYTKAIEQLGSGTIDIRIGGIYALERIARDSARDHSTVMEVLTAFIREHSPAGKSPGQIRAEDPPRVGADIDAALSVIRQRNQENDIRPIRLNDANLSRAYLTGVSLVGADLSDAVLSGALLIDADLTRADLVGASLSEADLTRADLARAYLDGANLRSATLTGAYLTRAQLTDADLTHAIMHSASLVGARLIRANLAGAYLGRADLTGAKLAGANLADADLPLTGLRGADLTDADLRGARLTSANLAGADLTGAIAAVSPVPARWRVSDEGRLERNPGAATPGDGPLT